MKTWFIYEDFINGRHVSSVHGHPVGNDSIEVVEKSEYDKLRDAAQALINDFNIKKDDILEKRSLQRNIVLDTEKFAALYDLVKGK